MPRIPGLIDAESVRLRISKEMIDQIDQMAIETPEATRSSMIRSLLRERLQQIAEVKEGMPGKSN